MSTITALKTAARTAPQSTPQPLLSPRAQSRKLALRLTRQRYAAIALGAVAVTLTALSLTHLAAGLAIVTHAPLWEAWAMAVGIDLGFITLELAQIAVTSDKLRSQLQRYVMPSIVGTLVGSAVMNAFAFASHADGALMTGGAIVMGAAIPALIYALTRIGAALYLDGSK